MMWPNGTKIIFKTIAGLVACIFLFQQLAWAGDLIDTVLNKQTDAQAQTFAPSYLQNQQSIQQGVVSQQQDAENFANNVSAVTTATTNNTQASTDDSSLPLKGPRSGGSSSGVKAAVAGQAASTTSGSTNPVMSVTTAAGDIINYQNNAIFSIQKKDGTVLTNIVVDANNNLTGAQITYTDGTVQIVVNGKVTQVANPDGRRTDEQSTRFVYPRADDDRR